jgi:aminoglycoside phosphotransferase
MADLFNSRDIVQMLENEVMAYEDLVSLQGSCLPELIAYGRTTSGMAWYLATSMIAGKTLDETDATSEAQLTSAMNVRACLRGEVMVRIDWLFHDLNGLELSQFATWLQGLREIHALGRLHGDLRGPNVMITKDDKVGFT